LVENGGHNYIESAAWGIPTLSGPSTFNFREIAATLQDIGALEIHSNPSELSEALFEWIDNPKLAHTKGETAKRFTEKNRGALEKLITLIDKQLANTEKP